MRFSSSTLQFALGSFAREAALSLSGPGAGCERAGSSFGLGGLSGAAGAEPELLSVSVDDMKVRLFRLLHSCRCSLLARDMAPWHHLDGTLLPKSILDNLNYNGIL